MKTTSLRSFLGLLALAAVVAIRLGPHSGGAPHATGMKSYTPFVSQSVHRRGCLDPESRALNRDVDVVRLAVEEETTLLVRVRGLDGLEPGIVVTADEGKAATQSWMREIGSHAASAFTATVVLPAAGAYSFVIADRRELTGDEMASGKGCFLADFQATAPPSKQVLPFVWRGTIGTPMVFSVPRRGHDLTLVEVAHTGGDGIVMASVFEDDDYVRTVTVVSKRSTRVLLTTRFENVHLLIEEAANWGREPLRVMVRAVPSAIAPGLEVEPTSAPDRIAATTDEELAP